MTRCATFLIEEPMPEPTHLYRKRVEAGVSLRLAASLIGVTPQALGDAEHRRGALPPAQWDSLMKHYEQRITIARIHKG